MIALVKTHICVKIWGSPLNTFYFMSNDPSYLPSHLARPSPKGKISEKTSILCNLLSFYVTIDIFEVIESEKNPVELQKYNPAGFRENILP